MPSPGALTKAGRVRQQTGRRGFRKEKGKKVYHEKKHKPPRIARRKAYLKLERWLQGINL